MPFDADQQAEVTVGIVVTRNCRCGASKVAAQPHAPCPGCGLIDPDAVEDHGVVPGTLVAADDSTQDQPDRAPWWRRKRSQ